MPSVVSVAPEKNQIGADEAGRFAGVLPQYPCLSILDLFGNQIGAEGAGSLAGVLPQCPALSILCLEDNQIGDEGARRLLSRSAAKVPSARFNDDLHLGGNVIGAEVAGRLRAAWRWPQSGLLLEMKTQDVVHDHNDVEDQNRVYACCCEWRYKSSSCLLHLSSEVSPVSPSCPSQRRKNIYAHTKKTPRIMRLDQSY